jgi:hypothetical protein
VTSYLTTKQVARMAGCSVRTVERACTDHEMKAEKKDDPNSLGYLRKRHQNRPQIWQIDIKSGTMWAQLYEPWKRMATA